MIKGNIFLRVAKDCVTLLNTNLGPNLADDTKEILALLNGCISNASTNFNRSNSVVLKRVCEQHVNKIHRSLSKGVKRGLDDLDYTKLDNSILCVYNEFSRLKKLVTVMLPQLSQLSPTYCPRLLPMQLPMQLPKQLPKQLPQCLHKQL